jgi:hypothetical protein
MDTGKLREIIVSEETASMLLSVDVSTDGKLILQIPRELIDRIANIGELVVFVDEVPADYRELDSSCDYRTIAINLEAGTETIELVGSFIIGQGYNDPTRSYSTLNVIIDGSKNHPVQTFTTDLICNWEFVKEEKKFILHSDNLTRIEITLPNELLGGPYSVFIDGKQISNFNQTDNENRSSTFLIESEKPVRTIEVIGTTAVPEFGSYLAMAMVAMSIGGAIVATRLKIKCRG